MKLENISQFRSHWQVHGVCQMHGLDIDF